jgi:uncharacterized membrane protein YgdD (TMEM256/DUF423 family)
MNHRTTLLSAGLLGLTGVAFGALGAHALRDFLQERGMTVAWETAARYHIIHSVALLAAGAGLRAGTGAVQRRLGWAAACWVAGTVLFSGSLYALALGGPHWMGPVTPLGGLVLMAGWLCVVAAAVPKES